MKSLAHIPDAELEDDRMASIEDLRLCAVALRAGVRAHSDGLTVLDRIRGNCDIIERIEAELLSRRAPVTLEDVAKQISRSKAAGRGEPYPSEPKEGAQ